MDHFYSAIPGWFDFLDYYQRVVRGLPDHAHIVEVGVYQGQSTAGLAVEIINSGKTITLDVVDWFRGSPSETGPQAQCDPVVLRATFERHVAPVRHAISHIHAMASVDAAALYADASLDFVWIDASHATQPVYDDLDAWWPKVKPGGIIAGHDADWPSVRAALKPWSEYRGVDVDEVSGRSWEARKPPRVTDWWVPMSRRRCLVAVASNERTIHRATVDSLVRLGWGQNVTRPASVHGFQDVSFAWVHRHTRVDDLRNEAVLVAQAAKASHLLFLDADMTWPPDVLEKMLAHHDRGIVSGLYHTKAWPNHPVAFSSGYANLRTGQVDYIYDEMIFGDALRPEALVGMGCALLPMALFEAMPMPWFEYRQDVNGVWSITEDVAFCQKAAAHGCPIWLDPTVQCGHIHADEIRAEHHMRSVLEARKIDEIRSRAVLRAVPA